MNSTPLSALSTQLADIIAAAAPSVVQVQGHRRPASGVVYADGLVLTTTRALGRENGITVKTNDGRALEAELGGWDPSTSLVLLRVNDLQSAAVRAEHRRTARRPSRHRRRPFVEQRADGLDRHHLRDRRADADRRGRAIDRVIRTDAAMHGGFAGGAVLDTDGRLAGIATAASIRGLGVVIPADIAWKSAATLAEHGAFKRGYLGITGQSVQLPESLASGDRTYALLVAGVSAASPAEAAGVLIGDLILAFDGRPIQSPVDLLELLQGDRVGRSAPLHIVRGGAPREIAITVGERPVR
jgi:S1-C subfamily serine protease